MKFYSVALTVALALVSGWVGAMSANSHHTSAQAQETTYERVTRTRTIRCGYTTWEPLFFVDAKTGEKKGIFHDLMEEAGKRLDLTIEWREEIGWGSVIEAVRSQRVDMACAGYWLNAGRIKNVQATIPQLYSPLYVYMRAKDSRVFTSPDALNDPAYSITIIDGSAEKQMVARRFSKSKSTSLPELNSSADTLQDLATNKADFLILDVATATSYMAKNPDKIKNAFPATPINLFPTVMLLPPGDEGLKEMIDNILLDIERDGTLDAILQKHNSDKLFIRNPKLR